MKYLIPLLFLLSSCSQQYFCRKCTQGTNRIEDVVTVFDTLYLPSQKIDTVVQWEYDLSTDTLIIEKNRVKIKYRDLPGPTVYLAAECEADTIYTEKKIPVVTEVVVNRGFTFWQVLLACLATAGALTVLYLVRKK